MEKKIKAILLKSGMRQSCPLPPLLFQNSSGKTNWRNKAREENERDTKRIEKVKLSLFADDIIQKFTEYTENF